MGDQTIRETLSEVDKSQMEENQEKEVVKTEAEEERKEKSILLIFRFILVPLVIVGIVVFIVVLFGSVALKQKSVRDYVFDIKTGSQSERWQAAYHLSSLLSNTKKDYRSEAKNLLPEIMLIFENEKGRDIQIRRYLALAMGNLEDSRAVPALQKAMDDEDSQTVLYSIWALGKIGDKNSTPLIIDKFESTDSAVRTMCAYVLGALEDSRAIPPLQAHLDDSDVKVRWNAAIALSRMKDPSGSDLLLQMMNRKYLAGFPDMSEERKEELLINAITASAKLGIPQLRDQIKTASLTDPNPRVRNAALRVLQ
jgi:HEAT repeat protein